MILRFNYKIKIKAVEKPLENSRFHYDLEIKKIISIKKMKQMKN